MLTVLWCNTKIVRMADSKERIETFFQQFKKLASTVDQLVEEYKTAVNDKSSRKFCAPQVKKKISDLRKDLKKMEPAVDKELADINQSVTKLDNMISAGNGFLDDILHKHEETEQYLKQYGYKTYDEVYGQKEKTENADEDIDEDNDVIEEEHEEERGAAAPPVDLNRTPQPEDFGISEMTLQIMKSVQKDKFSVQKPSVPRPDVSTIPSIFQHNGIICTPSLTGSLNPNASYCADLHAALASPMSEMSTVKETKPENNSLKTHEVKKSLSSVFKNEKHSSFSDPFQNKHSEGLFQSDTRTGTVKLFNQAQGEVYARAGGYDDMEPVEPELTYSLEALTEMTGMYKFNPVPKPPPATTTRSYTPVNEPVTSSAKPYSTYTQHRLNDDKENATPPEPRLLSEQVSRFKSNLPSTDKLDKITDIDTKKYLCDDMPPSPKLLGNYDFMK